MNLWITTSTQFNNLVKRFRTNLIGITDQDIKRRHVEEALAPCLNVGHDHPTLISQLKKAPKTIEGFLHTKATPELAKELKALTQVVENASMYEMRRDRLLNALRHGLTNKHYLPGTNIELTISPRLQGVTRVLLDWLETPNSNAKTKVSFIEDKGQTGMTYKANILLQWVSNGRYDLSIHLANEGSTWGTMNVTMVSLIKDGHKELRADDNSVEQANRLELYYGLAPVFTTDFLSFREPTPFGPPTEQDTALPVELLNIIDAQIKLKNL